MLRTIISIWRDFSSQMKKQNISAYASSTAFFLFLSVIPMLMVVCAVIPYTPVTEQNLVTALTDVTPDIADAMVESLVVDVYEFCGNSAGGSDRYGLVGGEGCHGTDAGIKCGQWCGREA